MAERRVTTFRLDDDLITGLQEVWSRDGIQPSEQVRRAIRAWLSQKGVLPKLARNGLQGGVSEARRRRRQKQGAGDERKTGRGIGRERNRRD